MVVTETQLDQQFAVAHDGERINGLIRSNTFVFDSRLGENEQWQTMITNHPWIVALRTAPTYEGQQYNKNTIQRLQSNIKGEVIPIAVYQSNGSTSQLDVVREDLFETPSTLTEQSKNLKNDFERRKLLLNAYQALTHQDNQQLRPI